ncbi:MAG: ErfK/YbiS/YcfS/YnhG family protein, partial [Candidatus Daviesbacteria bacterium GW2011_GWB1_41_5]
MKLVHKFLPLVLLVVIIFIVFSYLPIRRVIFYRLGITNDSTTSCCSVEEIMSSSGKFDEETAAAIFNNQVVDYPRTSLAYAYSESLAQSISNDGPTVLGAENTDKDEKWIDVSLDEQRLRAYEGNRVVLEFPISSGLWTPTPKGTFQIWHKTRSQRMKGGSKEMGTYYDLPNVPNNMFFYKGYAIHGAYWHNNFGHPMSHGCVNSPLSSVAKLFEWA